MTSNGIEQVGFKPDRTIHEPVRLQIISYLAASGRQVSFSDIRKNLGLTGGNLSVQLRKLEEVGYISITKSFKDRKPLTSVSLTRDGFDSFQRYLRDLERMINSLKNNTASSTGREDG
jgi:DNA-binding MarR family transcriptional regulator